MAINLAKKYSSKVVERFQQQSLTDKGLNNDYDWTGVRTVTVYSIPTVTMNDYTMSGSSRYGTPAELGDTVQELTVTKDRSFTVTIDKRNNMDQMGVKESGKVLARQTKEVITPEIDTYRLSVWASATNTQTTGAAVAVDKTNAYTLVLTAQEKLDNENVPSEGRLLYATPGFINLLKLDPNFTKSGDLAQKNLIKGQVGEVDGAAVVKIPGTKMPAKTPFILIHPSCSCSPMKLEDYKTHDNPPGINGKLIEGRVVYDCFVFDTLGKAICKHMTV